MCFLAKYFCRISEKIMLCTDSPIDGTTLEIAETQKMLDERMRIEMELYYHRFVKASVETPAPVFLVPVRETGVNSVPEEESILQNGNAKPPTQAPTELNGNTNESVLDEANPFSLLISKNESNPLKNKKCLSIIKKTTYAKVSRSQKKNDGASVVNATKDSKVTKNLKKSTTKSSHKQIVVVHEEYIPIQFEIKTSVSQDRMYSRYQEVGSSVKLRGEVLKTKVFTLNQVGITNC